MLELQVKVEGTNVFPRGCFKLKYAVYRKERIKNIRSKVLIKKIMGWCDDINDKKIITG